MILGLFRAPVPWLWWLRKGEPVLRLVTNNTPAPLDVPPVLRVALDGVHRAGYAVLGPVTLVLRPRETVALTGALGTGKTTLLRVISGLEQGQLGQIARPERISAIFADPALLPWRTCRENLTLTLGISALTAENALAEVGLGGLGGDYPDQLTPAQQIRLALARALACDPQVLLMDDPFAALPPDEAEALMSLYHRLMAGRALATLLATNDARLAARLAQRTLRLTGTPASLR